MFVWAGDPAAGQAAIQPFREVATPLIDMAMPMPYPAIYQLTAEAEKRALAVHRSRFLDTLDDAAVDAILDATAAPSSPIAMVQLRVLGGAMARVPADDDGVRPPRRAGHGRDHHAVRGPGHRSRPSGHGPRRSTMRSAPDDAGVYSNFLEAEGDERIRAAYPAGTYERLADIKRRYDPRNLFRMNQNIRPAPLG